MSIEVVRPRATPYVLVDQVYDDQPAVRLQADGMLSIRVYGSSGQFVVNADDLQEALDEIAEMRREVD